MRDVRGQPQARRALEVAAAGGHHLLLIGTPGCGKTLLASRLPGILPGATELEALETATVASCSSGIDTARWRQRPYRSLHHTASAVSLVGGVSRVTISATESWKARLVLTTDSRAQLRYARLGAGWLSVCKRTPPP